MNTLNKITILILLCILLPACGGSSNSAEEKQPTTDSSQTNSTDDNTSDSNSSSGSSDQSSGQDNDQTDDSSGQANNNNHAFKVTVNDGLAPLLIDTPDENEHLSAGIGTTKIIDKDAYSQALPEIVKNAQSDAVFKVGDHIFRSNHDGQGPLFNNTTCQGCHIKDGRGEVPVTPNDPMLSMFLRIGDSKGNIDPIYGDQLQVFGTLDDVDGGALPKYQGAINEGKAYGEAYTWVEYETIEGQFADGESYSLRKPIYKVKDLAYGDFNTDVQFSARVSPHVYGSGLLESIPAKYILAYADPEDTNNDGISGRAANTTHPITNEIMLARFGQKAVTASVLQQISGAYRGDMGVTNSVNPGEVCSDLQEACIAQAAKENDRHHEGVDLNDIDLAQVEFYNRTLAVPVRRGYDEQSGLWDEQVLKGRAQFYQANCHSCHVPRFKTGEAKGSLLGDVDLVMLKDSRSNISQLEQLVIYPYTDLLLHDMGGSCKVTRELDSGEKCESGALCYYVQRCEGLADGRPEGEASGTEWKTPALWGLGLVKTVNPKATFLHDGRARTIAEAILWHGGEASNAQQAFINMDKSNREALIAFLNSL